MMPLPKGRVSAVRSRNMAAIKGKDTKPEMIVRRALHAAGFRYRLHQRDLPGSPDIVLTRLRTAVFVHGCFWHRHGCSRSTWPTTRAAFWRAKISGNQDRDRRVRHFLRDAGWKVEIVWECELASAARLNRLLRDLSRRRTALEAT